ncbi:hypothetical protein Trydic_g20475 [Trypoxylus dichotomus]
MNSSARHVDTITESTSEKTNKKANLSQHQVRVWCAYVSAATRSISQLLIIAYLYLHLSPALRANRDLTSNLQSRSFVTMPYCDYYNTIRRSKNLITFEVSKARKK